jgi:transposase|tara:strand:- start:376 stop:1386 length:1011 start_codon:yes stop_codon:yes gene_type:complete
MKYLAFDAHATHCVLSVRNARGEEIDRRSMTTNANQLIGAVRAVSGRKVVTTEEGQLAGWLFHTLEPYADQFIICNPKKNSWIAKDDKKDDLSDASKLSHLLFGGYLKPVHHPEKKRQMFKDLVLHYHMVSDELVKIKNRIKSRYLRNGLQCVSNDVYRQDRREKWICQLPQMTRMEVQDLYGCLDLQVDLKNRVKKRMAQEAKKHPQLQRLLKYPGIGPVRASTFYAIIDTPHRFQKKSKIWVYCGIGLTSRSSGAKPARQHRNQSYNRKLKWVVMGAARTAICTKKDNPFKDHYQILLNKGVHHKEAVVRVARKITSSMWGMWRANQDYHPQMR